jgi:predicted PurR-regulated permease PerM
MADPALAPEPGPAASADPPTPSILSGDRPAHRVAIMVIAVVVGIAGLRAAGTILLPVMLAGFLVIVVQPVVGALIDLRVPRVPAVLLTILLLAVVLFGLGAYLGDALSRFTDVLPEYQAPLERRFGYLQEWLVARGVPTDRLQFDGLLDGGAIADSARGLLSAVVSLISNLVMVVIVSAFALLESTALAEKAQAAFGDAAAGRLRTSVGTVQRYIGLKTLISMVTGVLAGGLCWSLGVDFPVVWGFVAFVLNFIPNVGSAVAAIPPVILSLVQVEWPSTVALMAGYGLINVGLGSVLEPRIMGRRLGLSPLVVFLSLVFWGWVWGPVGMLISVPLTVVVKLFLEQDDQTRWLAILLGPGDEVERMEEDATIRLAARVEAERDAVE